MRTIQPAHPECSGETVSIPEGWNILCDFDGTITPFDVTDAILDRFALPEWENIEEAWQNGAITSRECMGRQVSLLRAPRKTLDAFLDTVPVDEGFYDFVHHCGTRGYPLRIVSDGMDYAIRRILTGHGLERIPVIANRLVCSGADTYRLEFPHSHGNCGSGVCKCRVAGNGKTLLIGDGRSDCCLAGNVSLVLAKADKELARHCRNKRYPHIVYKDFYDVCALFDSWSRDKRRSGKKAEDARAAGIA